MQCVRFGRTNLMVSRIGFGGAPAGVKNYLYAYDPTDKESRKKILKAIDKALELGINYFDTAPSYGEGQSEEMIGEALRGVTKPVILATKVNLGDTDHLHKSIEGSLKRLKRDYVDILQIHGVSYTDEDMDLVLKEGGMLDEMIKLKRGNIVRFIGFTVEDNNVAVYKFIRSGKFDMIQICYNFLFQHPYEPSRPFGSLYEAEKADLGIATMRATTSGTFQRWIKMVNPDNAFDYTKVLIQFVLSNPLVDVALIGMRSPERVIQNVEICNDTSARINIDEVHGRFG